MDNPAYVIDCEREFDTAEGREENLTEKPRTHSFEEAITLTGVGRFHYQLLLICGLCFMAVMVEIMGVSLIMNQMKCDLQPTLDQQGILASAGFLGVVLSSHAMGFLADTWGRATTLKYALFLSSVCSIVSGFSVNIWMLIVLRFLTGFFISGGQACVFSLCGEFHGSGSRVRHVTLLSGFLCMAMIFAPAMAIGILPLRIESIVFGMRFSSWRVLLLANVSVSLLALVGISILPETPKYLLVQGRGEQSLEILRTIFAKNSGRDPSEYPVKEVALESGGASLSDVHGVLDAVRLVWHQTVPLFHRSRLWHTLNICTIQFLIYFLAQGIFMWFPTILDELGTRNGEDTLLCHVLQNFTVGSGSESESESVDEVASCAVDVDTSTYQVMIIIGACFVVIYLIFAYIIDYIGKKNLLMSWMLLTMICLVGLHYVEQFALVVIALTVVMAIGNCGGLVSTIAMEFYPTHINAMGMCFIMMVGRLGAVVGSNILGRLLFASCDPIFWALLALVVLLCSLGYFLPEKSSARQTKPSATAKAIVVATTSPIFAINSK
ncbi:synaptic vesicle 2-related protein [Drosophila gunungcola]|uniref:synaptic vesicle 2-related protein n=1 Tax=Drosophila gunungcola TaxID=103775 RepID=UPI0022E7A744|nr:synaptic vesicle 2-related protein [Drosophila gunungcola]